MGASCYHTITDYHEDMTQAEFEKWLIDLNDPTICTHVRSFTEWKETIEKLCSICKCCDYETEGPK